MDGLDVTQGSLKNDFGGTQMVNELLHETSEWGDTSLPRVTSRSRTVERWRRRREQGHFDGGGRNDRQNSTFKMYQLQVVP